MNKEEEEKKRLMISLGKEQFKKLEEVSKETKISKSAIMAIAFSDWLLRRER